MILHSVHQWEGQNSKQASSKSSNLNNPVRVTLHRVTGFSRSDWFDRNISDMLFTLFAKLNKIHSKKKEKHVRDEGWKEWKGGIQSFVFFFSLSTTSMILTHQ